VSLKPAGHPEKNQKSHLRQSDTKKVISLECRNFSTFSKRKKKVYKVADSAERRSQKPEVAIWQFSYGMLKVQKLLLMVKQLLQIILLILNTISFLHCATPRS